MERLLGGSGRGCIQLPTLAEECACIRAHSLVRPRGVSPLQTRNPRRLCLLSDPSHNDRVDSCRERLDMILMVTIHVMNEAS